MPAYLVHRLAGETVKQKLKKVIPDENTFVVGLQGGDLFFFYRYLLLKNKGLGLKLGARCMRSKTKEFL